MAENLHHEQKNPTWSLNVKCPHCNSMVLINDKQNLYWLTWIERLGLYNKPYKELITDCPTCKAKLRLDNYGIIPPEYGTIPASILAQLPIHCLD